MQRHTEEPLSALVDMIGEEFPRLLAVYRFGSFGSEYERPASDLAVCAERPLPAVKLWRMAQELAANVGRVVDLMDLASASAVMRTLIIHDGKRIYCADEVACETFENYVYSSYVRLNEERRGSWRTSLTGEASMADEVVLNKVAVIERRLRRITEEYVNSEDGLKTNHARRDAIVLNLLRASETSIDLATHAARVGRLGLPQDQKLSLEIVKSILEDRLNDFRDFAAAVLGTEIVSRADHRERHRH